VALALAACTAPAAAADRDALWPEIDAYFPLGEQTRLMLLAAGNWMGGELQDRTLGAHLDVTLTPVFRRRLLAGDWERNRYLWMRLGYRYINSPHDMPAAGGFKENRGIFEMTGRTPPLAGGLEWIGRFRWDARDVNDVGSNRYRLRVQVEKAFDWSGRAVIPFVNAETFYDTRFDAWSRQRYQVGAEIVLNDRWRVEPAFNYQADSRSEPTVLRAIGLTFKYFH
jgi:hypothetical protein